MKCLIVFHIKWINFNFSFKNQICWLSLIFCLPKYWSLSIIFIPNTIIYYSRVHELLNLKSRRKRKNIVSHRFTQFVEYFWNLNQSIIFFNLLNSSNKNRNWRTIINPRIVSSRRLSQKLMFSPQNHGIWSRRPHDYITGVWPCAALSHYICSRVSGSRCYPRRAYLSYSGGFEFESAIPKNNNNKKHTQQSLNPGAIIRTTYNKSASNAMHTRQLPKRWCDDRTPAAQSAHCKFITQWMGCCR